MGRLTAMPARMAASAPRLRAPPKSADPFYLSREWRALVAQIKRERGPWCQRCGSTRRVIGDHIVELKDGGPPLDPANIELLCFTHHQGKTAKAKAERARSLR